MKTVFTNGCFDVFHRGHLELLRHCRSLGRRVVVGLNSDDSIRRIKGKDRPIICQDDRKALLEELRCVDEVVIFDEDTPEKLIQTICPDVLVKGKDYIGKFIAGEDFMHRNNKRVELVDMIDNKSTSSIIDKISKENPS